MVLNFGVLYNARKGASIDEEGNWYYPSAHVRGTASPQDCMLNNIAEDILDDIEAKIGRRVSISDIEQRPNNDQQFRIFLNGNFVLYKMPNILYEDCVRAITKALTIYVTEHDSVYEYLSMRGDGYRIDSLTPEIISGFNPGTKVFGDDISILQATTLLGKRCSVFIVDTGDDKEISVGGILRTGKIYELQSIQMRVV
jgi:hypothetical protein